MLNLFKDEFDYLTTSFYRNAMGILVVYDKTKVSSFQNLPKWLQKIKTHANDSAEVIILCNKSDAKEEEVEVSNDLADNFSRKSGIPILATSARGNLNIKEPFITMSERILYTSNTKSSLTMKPTAFKTEAKPWPSLFCCKHVLLGMNNDLLRELS